MQLSVAGSAVVPALKCLNMDYFEFVPLAAKLGVAGLELTASCVVGESEGERRDWLAKMAAVLQANDLTAPCYMI